MSDETKQKDFGTICLNWWRVLTNKDIGRSRADLARLKRVNLVADALVIHSVHDLNKSLADEGCDMRRCPDKLALITVALAQIKESNNLRLAQIMGQGNQKLLSEIRFDRLIRIQEPAELAVQLRRALAVVGHRANVARLAQDLFYWNDKTRAAWCFDYYGASSATTETDQPS